MAVGNTPGAVDSEDYARQLQAQYDAEAVVDEDEEEDEEEAHGRQRRRNRAKKGRKKGRGPGNAATLDGVDLQDNKDIEMMAQDFGREHFRKLIKKTFDDYYPLEYNKSTFKMDQYLDVVTKESLEDKYSKHLEMNDENILTLRNMPWLDLGELPVSYNTLKSEAFQVYLVPQNELPMNMVVPYSSWSQKYDNTVAGKYYGQTALSDRGISIEEVYDTLQRATQLV